MKSMLRTIMSDTSVLLVLAITSIFLHTATGQESLFECPKGWRIHGLHCYQFFNIRHSWQKASELCGRYGSKLVTVSSYEQNNFTAQLAVEYLSGQDDRSYWLGLQAHNDLATNLLDADDGDQIQQYYGHWATGQPNVEHGNCVQGVLKGTEKEDVRQEWELFTCEALMPFMCRIRACPSNTFHCSNGNCINREYLCDGENDCGDDSDELGGPAGEPAFQKCEEQCKYHFESSGDQFQSTNFNSETLGHYRPFSNCKWTLEGPRGTTIALRFSEFNTEENFDTVQILGGGRTEDTAVNIATLSGNLENLNEQTFVSASNFMIIKFKSDGAVEKSGFRASWRTEPQSCGGDHYATSSHQVIDSPNYPNVPYPGGLECLHTISAPKGKIITLEIEDFEMEPEKDFVLIRDGDRADAKELARLTGTRDQNPQFVTSTGNKLYIYTKTDQADSRRGYRIKYYEGCNVVINRYDGKITSPAFDKPETNGYPPNQECIYTLRHPAGTKLSMMFTHLDLHSSDTIQVFDGDSNGVQLHEGLQLPNSMLSAESGQMQIRFKTDASQNAGGFSAVFSSDCPDLEPGEGAIRQGNVPVLSGAPLDTVFGSKISFACPDGQVFATGGKQIHTECMPGGEWNQTYIPKCQDVYCGPVPQIDNGFAIGATRRVSFGASATYQCYAGFRFSSGRPIEAIECTAVGEWSTLPVCQASQCPPLRSVEHATAEQLAGSGMNYGTVIRYECNPGYERTGYPVLLCQSNGTWSSGQPRCTRKRCYDFPKLENGYITRKNKEYYYGDETSAECYTGYRRIGSNIIQCGPNQTFSSLPKCEDQNECEADMCGFKSTECENRPGSYHCKCRPGFEPNLECRESIFLGLSGGGIPDESITVSDAEEGYPKEMARLNSEIGWCGTSSLTGTTTTNAGNWIMVDLKAPSVITGFRTQGVYRKDGKLAFPTAIRLMHTNDLTDVMQEFRNVDGSPVEFRVLQGDSMSVMNLPLPIEARYLRLNILNFTENPCVRLEVQGCQKQTCNDINECLKNNGGCNQKCINVPGSFSCGCIQGYQLFTKEGISNYYTSESETGDKDGDSYQFNKTCVKKMCPALDPPENGRFLTDLETYRFGDLVSFMCDFGYVLEGSSTLICTSAAQWNGTVPLCRPASCSSAVDDEGEGLLVIREDPDNLQLTLGANVTLQCDQIGKPLRSTTTANFRQCVYNPLPGSPDYWLSGRDPECPRIDCGLPPKIPGADYGQLFDTTFGSSFGFGCKDEAFRLVGQSSKQDNLVRCGFDGVWDFGDLRCEGPVCEDPRRPPDGGQIAQSYEQGAEVTFTCHRDGYIPINPAPIKCIEQPECKVVAPLGITSGNISDALINATSERGNYEAKNIRLNSVTGWCGKKEAFTYVNVELNDVSMIKAILVKGVITDDVVGRPTEIRFFYKETEEENYVVYFPNFNLTARDPGNYGELAMITLPLSVRAKYVILGIVSYDENPCLKFELMGCPVANEPLYLGYDNGFPICVDNEPPAFLNCPSFPIEVQKGPQGYMPVDFKAPVAQDNSGAIARMEVVTITSSGKSEGFPMPMTTFQDMMVEYYAYDFDGNVAICQVNITVPDDTPPSLACPRSFVIELLNEEESYNVDFKRLRNQVNVSDPSGDVTVTFLPEKATIRIGGYENVTVVASDASGNQARCHFQVAIKPTACVDWELQSPIHGDIDCIGKSETSLRCVARCDSGYRFTDGDREKVFSCSKLAPKWAPSKVIPDCVSEDTTFSTYDVEAKIMYRGNGAVEQACVQDYINYVSDYQPGIASILTDRCSAGSGGVEVTVDFKPTFAKKTSENLVEITYFIMVTPALPEPRVYDICGQTHDLIFDLEIKRTNEIIADLLQIPSLVPDSREGKCPPLTALETTLSRGFVCADGGVLNNITASNVPRCLECPAGFFAAKGATGCTACPKGMYQDQPRQGSCKPCPEGTYTSEMGTKSGGECVPVCGYGTYSPSGLVPCLECQRNSYSGEPPVDGFKECTSCPDGQFTFQPGAQHVGQCRQRCEPGTYSDTGLMPCAPCPNNFFQPLSGQRDCFECHSTEETLGTGTNAKAGCTDVICSEGLCEHGGLCLAVHHREKCFCPAGFTGPRCDVNVDECASQPCYNGGTCEDSAQGYRCLCLAGYTGLQCQIEDSDCDKSPCPARAMCRDEPGLNNYTCLCRSGYKGENCDVTVDPCESNPCRNGAQCEKFEQGRFFCRCPEGWEGALCEQNIDDCAEQPCLLGANCTDLVHDYRCDCPNGFSGKRCQEKVDLCLTAECENGECVDKLFRYECICRPGFEGEMCEINTDNCGGSTTDPTNPANPCQSGGQCIDQVNDYSCVCEAGFTGKSCQHPIDYCASEPCRNSATCKNAHLDFECECRPGFGGRFCESDNNECAINPCDPTGTAKCHDLNNKFECECRDGYTGEFCQTNTNECANSPCMNGGSCRNKIGSFECDCAAGWTGSRCEKASGRCDPDPCENDAQCVDLFEDYFCVCPKGNDGKNCETVPNRCVGDPCVNGGSCNDKGSSMSCRCKEGYTGIGCQFEYDACKAGACQNGATCIDNGGSDYECICAPGYGGKNCSLNIDDCRYSDGRDKCPAAAKSIDLTNDCYCRCPFNLTGENCQKTIQTDYDLHFTDASRSSSASLVVPFAFDGYVARQGSGAGFGPSFGELSRGSRDQLTVAMWVQFDRAGAVGTYFTLYSVDSEYHPTNKHVMLQANNVGVLVDLFGPDDPEGNKVNLQFPVINGWNIADGKWHHVALAWSGITGTLTLISDGVIGGKMENIGQGKVLPEFGYVTLGSTDSVGSGRTRTESGFQGKLTRVQVWDREWSANDLQNQVQNCRSAPLLFDGLILRWSGYDRTVGGVERIMPSICGELQCPLGRSGQNCESLDADKEPPIVDFCPSGDMYVDTERGSESVTWDIPSFRDLNSTDLVIRNKDGLVPGQPLQPGAYDVAYVAYDTAGNTAICDFKIYVRLTSACPPLDPPKFGFQECEKWGPGGRFLQCTVGCDAGYRFSQEVPDYYTCGAEGFWRPNLLAQSGGDVDAPFVYPACSKASSAQKIYKINLSYLTGVLCNEAGKGVLKSKVTEALQELNQEWKFSSCNELNEASCEDLGIDISCNKRTPGKIKGDQRRFKRQIGDLTNPTGEEQTYELEITFPTQDTDDAVNSEGITKKIDQLINDLILEQNKLDVSELLPNVKVQEPSILIDAGYTCDEGHVVRGNVCVPCPEGTFFDTEEASCKSCPMGTYNNQIGRVGQCEVCPTNSNDRQQTTETMASTKIDDCKEKCKRGMYFDKITNLCRPCTHGDYQPEEGKFNCKRCAQGFTTRTENAVDKSECRPECPDGKQLSVDGNCEPCPIGTYRKIGFHKSCVKCDSGFVTELNGATDKSMCSVPICPPGKMLDTRLNPKRCVECPKGFYQDQDQQTICAQCPPDTSTEGTGANSKDDCTNSCRDSKNSTSLCDKNADCWFIKETNGHECRCKKGFQIDGYKIDPITRLQNPKNPICLDNCIDRTSRNKVCKNQGICLKDHKRGGKAICQCAGSFTGEHCQEKSEFAYIAGGVAGAVIFLILLVLLIWMICVRASRAHRTSPEKILGAATDQNGSQVNFYYGAPAPYAESIAPSHHSTYAHYYDDEEDGWEMPNFYNETYMKDGLHAQNKMNSLARSNASLSGYGGTVPPGQVPNGAKDDLYDRLRRHAYQGKKSDKSGNETTSDSDGQ